MRNRTVLAGNLALGAVLRLCEGHGARDHQPIKGLIEPGLSRSDYVLANHSRFIRELVKELVGGMWIREPGKALAGASGRRQRDALFLDEEGGLAEGEEDDPTLLCLQDDDDEPEEIWAAKKASAKKPAAKAKAKAASSGRAAASASSSSRSSAALPPAPAAAAGDRAPYVKTTCPGCLDPTGRTLHTNDNRCRDFRHREAMKRYQAKVKDRSRENQGAAMAAASSAVARQAAADAAAAERSVPSSSSSSAAAAAPVAAEGNGIDDLFGGEGEARRVASAPGKEEPQNPDDQDAPGPGDAKAEVKGEASAKREVAEVERPSAIPRGAWLRALMRGGPGAARVTREIHRRWTHMPAREMEASFRKAGVPPEVIADVKRIVGECPQCRMWVNLPPR